MTAQRAVAAILLFLVGPVMAAAECNDDEGTRNSIYRNCLKPKLDEANAKVKGEMDALVARANNSIAAHTTVVEHLLKAQENWQHYRDRFCEARGLLVVGGQSARLLPETECLIEMTQQRAAELQQLREGLH
jgi:uncharacterized protein YecT (DUF1311 family)